MEPMVLSAIGSGLMPGNAQLCFFGRFLRPVSSQKEFSISTGPVTPAPASTILIAAHLNQFAIHTEIL